MKDSFFNFVKSPDRESYLKVRSLLVSSDHYSPYSNEMEEIYELLESDNLIEAKETLSESMPNLMLSPEAHIILSYIYDQLNDEKGAQMEKLIADACIQGILASGDGTKEYPYFVARTSDEYDIIRYIGKNSIGQTLIQDGNRHLDVINCDDGTKIYFNITDVYNSLEGTFSD